MDKEKLRKLIEQNQELRAMVDEQGEEEVIEALGNVLEAFKVAIDIVMEQVVEVFKRVYINESI